MQIHRTNGQWFSAEYSTFSVTDEVGKYQLTVAGYSGDAGDAIVGGEQPNNGMKFTTPDSDNDSWASGNCGIDHGAGWWYRHCSTSELNQDIDGVWKTVGVVRDVRDSRMLVKLD